MEAAKRTPIECDLNKVDLFILDDQTDLMQMLESHLTLLNVLLRAQEGRSIRARATEWQGKLQHAREILELWLGVQAGRVTKTQFMVLECVLGIVWKPV